MEKGFTQMDIDEWQLLCHKTSHTFVQESVLPSQAMEEELLSLGSNIKQQDFTPPSQPNIQATKAEPDEEVIEENELAQLCKYEEQTEEEEEEETDDEQAMAFKTTSDGNSEGLSFSEGDEGEELGEMVEYTGPESEQKSGCNRFRFITLLRSAGLAAATFSIFLLQKSMPKNQKVQFRLSKNEKPERLFQHQQEVPELFAATSHSSFSGHYEIWY